MLSLADLMGKWPGKLAVQLAPGQGENACQPEGETSWRIFCNYCIVVTGWQHIASCPDRKCIARHSTDVTLDNIKSDVSCCGSSTGGAWHH